MHCGMCLWQRSYSETYLPMWKDQNLGMHYKKDKPIIVDWGEHILKKRHKTQLLWYIIKSTGTRRMKKTHQKTWWMETKNNLVVKIQKRKMWCSPGVCRCIAALSAPSRHAPFASRRRCQRCPRHQTSEYSAQQQNVHFESIYSSSLTIYQYSRKEAKHEKIKKNIK